MGGAEAEFPLLSALGLYAADIRGDGKCNSPARTPAHRVRSSGSFVLLCALLNVLPTQATASSTLSPTRCTVTSMNTPTFARVS